MTMIIDKPGFYKTRDGRKVRIIAVAEGWAMGLLTIADNYGPYCWVSDSGVLEGYHPNNNIISPWIEQPKPLECWVNQYERDFSAYSTEEHARAAATLDATRTAVHMREVRE